MTEQKFFRGTAFIISGIVLLFGLVLSCAPSAESDRAAENGLLVSAKEHLSRGDFEGAIEYCNRIIEINPENAGAWTNRGIARGALGGFAGAIQDHSKAIEVDSQLAEAHYNRGMIHIKVGNREAAVKDCTQAIALSAEYARAYCCRGRARYEPPPVSRQVRLRQDLEAAFEDYNKAIEIDPMLPCGYIGRADTLAGQGQYGKALEDYTRAIALDPQSAESYHKRAVVRSLLDDAFGPAKEDMQRARQIGQSKAAANCPVWKSALPRQDLRRCPD